MVSHILPFEKLQGLGNDFVFVHQKHLPSQLSESELARMICQRRFGIGADGLLILKASQDPRHFAWEYLNADGSYGEMCGNGIRCFAKTLYDRGIARERELSIETKAGLIHCQILEDEQVAVNMGPAVLEPSSIPCSLEALTGNFQVPLRRVPLTIETGETFEVTPIGTGNPHAVVFCSDEETWTQIDLERVGSALERHAFFPNRANIEFAWIAAPDYIKMKVWERGAGATLACGTGACATVVAATINGLLASAQKTTVELPGGKLQITWQQDSNQIHMTGSAMSVYTGQFEIQL